MTQIVIDYKSHKGCGDLLPIIPPRTDAGTDQGERVAEVIALDKEIAWLEARREKLIREFIRDSFC